MQEQVRLVPPGCGTAVDKKFQGRDEGVGVYPLQGMDCVKVSMHSLPTLLGEGAGILQIRQCGLNLSPRSMLSSNRVAAISSCTHTETRRR